MGTIELYFFTDALPEGCVLQHETWELPSWVAGHFAERHFVERHFAERHFAERTFCRTDRLTNGLFAEKTFCRNDNLPKIEKF